MSTQNPTIFRPEALEHRIRQQRLRRTELRLPWLMSRSVTIALWTMLALLVLGGGGACFMPVQVSASGLAVVSADATTAGESTVVAVLLSSDLRFRLHPGQSAEVTLGTTGATISGTVAAIEQGTLGPVEAGQRVGLSGPALALIPGPVVLAWISLDAGDQDTIGAGAFGQADLAIGSRQAGSFLPLVGNLFGK